ncbi:putative ribonuclease H protein [Glycine soja]
MSVLQAPTYVLQMTWLPKSIYDAIDRKCRDFMWGDTPQRSKIHMLPWESLCVSKHLGGLELRETRVVN